MSRLEGDDYGGRGYDEHGEYGRGGSGRHPVAGGSGGGRGALDRGARGRAHGRESAATTRYSDESIVESMAKATLSTEDTKRSEDEVVTEKVVKRKWFKIPDSKRKRRDIKTEGIVPTVDRSKPMRALRVAGGRQLIEWMPIPQLPEDTDAVNWTLVRMDYAFIKRKIAKRAIRKGSVVPMTHALGTVVSALSPALKKTLGRRVIISPSEDRNEVHQYVLANWFQLKIVENPKLERRILAKPYDDVLYKAFGFMERLCLNTKKQRTSLKRHHFVFLVFGSNATAILCIAVLSVCFGKKGKVVAVVESGESREVKARIRKFGAHLVVEWKSVRALAAELAKVSVASKVRNLIDLSGDSERVFDCMDLVLKKGHVVFGTTQFFKRGKWIAKDKSHRKDVQFHYGWRHFDEELYRERTRKKDRVFEALNERGILLAEAFGAVLPLSRLPKYTFEDKCTETIIDMWK